MIRLAFQNGQKLRKYLLKGSFLVLNGGGPLNGKNEFLFGQRKPGEVTLL